MIEKLTFEQKVDLLKQLVDDLDIELTAHCGETGYFSSKDIVIVNGTEKISIWTGIFTG